LNNTSAPSFDAKNLTFGSQESVGPTPAGDFFTA
jgi:hypothetical protein